jgi:CheY-like chemotaxis protein
VEEHHGTMNDRPSNRKALVVDGDQETLSLTAEALHSFAPGFDVATANDPGQAIAWLETFHPDILLLSEAYAASNHHMLAARVRADEHTKHCKIIMVSEAALDGSKATERPGGPDATLTKPLNLPLLLQTVRKVLEH